MQIGALLFDNCRLYMKSVTISGTLSHLINRPKAALSELIFRKEVTGSSTYTRETELWQLDFFSLASPRLVGFLKLTVGSSRAVAEIKL